MTVLPEENDQLAPSTDLEAPERPDWLNPRYQSVEDQARAYSEAERRMTEASQRASAHEQTIAQLGERLNDLEQRAHTPQQGYDPQSDPRLLAEMQAWEEGDTMRALQLRDLRTVEMLQAAQQMWQPPRGAAGEKTIDELAAGFVEQAVARKLGPNYDAIRQDLQEAIQQRPHAVRDFRQDPHGAVDDILEIAEGITTRKQLTEQTARLSTQQQAAEQAAREKRQAQTAWGGNGPPAGNPSDREALIKAMQKLPKANSLLA